MVIPVNKNGHQEMKIRIMHMQKMFNSTQYFEKQKKALMPISLNDLKRHAFTIRNPERPLAPATIDPEIPPLEGKKKKADQVVKSVCRLFRGVIKKRFKNIHGKRFYFWVSQTKKDKTKEFFMSKNGFYKIPKWFYDKHENIFYALIHNYEFTRDKSN